MTAARGKAPAAEVLAARRGLAPAATQSLPRDIATYTGRQAELAHLMGTLAATAVGGGMAGIHAIDGWPGSARRQPEQSTQAKR